MDRHIVQEKISVSVVVKMKVAIALCHSWKIFSVLVNILVINNCNIFKFLVANTGLATELSFFVSLFTVMIY